MSSSLDTLLKDESTRQITLNVLKTLEEGGAVVTEKIKDERKRRVLEKALEEYGARLSRSGAWKKKKNHSKDRESKRQRQTSEPDHMNIPAPQMEMKSARNVYGPVPTDKADGDDEEEDEEAGPLPASSASRRPVASTAANASVEVKSQRGGWMFENLPESDPHRHLRTEAMTSQKGRSFNNFKTTPSGQVQLPGAESRAVATGKDQPTHLVLPNDPAFRWNHEEMMGEEKVDKNRIARIMSEKVDTKFAPASGKYL